MARKPKKTNIVRDYVLNHSNETVTVQKLADLADCTVQNVYVFIRNNPDLFELISRGNYRILPVSEESTVNVNTVELD
jgi:hypothetical protein